MEPLHLLMNLDLPNDADGGAIRRIINDGADLSRPMLIDFQIAAPNEQAAKEIAEVAARLGYRTQIYQDSEDGNWTAECSTRTLLSYQTVIALQAELHTLAEPLGGYIDGWATFGNHQTDRN